MKSDFDKLLDRYMKSQLTDAEKLKMDAWLDVMKTKKVEHKDITDQDLQELFAKITNNVISVKEVSAFRPRKAGILMTTWFRAAAAIIVMTAVSLLVWQFATTHNYEKTAVNDIEKVQLADGTLVWLRKGTTLVYSDDPVDMRHVTLDGEALFEVAKDAAHPFTITHGELLATVRGTSFNLKTGEKQWELKVLTGLVVLSSAHDVQGIEVNPNEEVVYAGQPTANISRLDPAEIEMVTSGTEYDLNLEGISMNEVFDLLAKKFDVKFVLENNQTYTCKITADLTDHSLQSTMEMLSELMDVEFRIEDRVVSVIGNGCR